MPVYEYHCTACGERTHRLQEVGEDSTGMDCLTCGNGVIKKVFSVFGTPGDNIRRDCSTGEQSRFT